MEADRYSACTGGGWEKETTTSASKFKAEISPTSSSRFSFYFAAFRLIPTYKLLVAPFVNHHKETRNACRILPINKYGMGEDKFTKSFGYGCVAH